jgi:S-adenosylmethionine-diacylglycerol 3-amino-3-carboxypropyl transferase
MKSFFNRIVYSSANEDERSEVYSLQGKHTILCITGSGSRPLSLLSDTVEQIVSIDFNPTQNHLLALKIACYRALDYEDCIGFLGVCESSRAFRVETYQNKLRRCLPESSQSYWDSNLRLIERGVWTAGLWERFLKLITLPAKTKNCDFDALFESDNVTEQQSVWRNRCSTFWFSTYLSLISSRFLWEHIFREPGIKCIPKETSIKGFLMESLDRFTGKHLLRQSPYGHFFLRGKFDINCLPEHMQREHYARIRRNIGKIQIRTESLLDHLYDHPNRYDGFSLSDFSSYTDDKTYETIWKAVESSAANGAVACERQFIIKRDPLNHLSALCSRDETAEAHLLNTDTSIFYSFSFVQFPSTETRC